MLLSEVVETSVAVGATSARLGKVQHLAATVRRLQPEEAAVGVAFLSGQLRQRQVGVGYASIRDLPSPADASTLTLLDVDGRLETIGRQSGPDSQGARRTLLRELFNRATHPEQDF